MEYKELFEKASAELEKLKENKAKLEQQISSLLQELDIPEEGDIEKAAEAFQKDLEASQAATTKELDALIKQFNESNG